MKRVWLLRHAKSSWDDPALDDHERPLAPRGRKAARRLSRWAAANDMRPDLVLCSTATRARATLELLGGAVGDSEPSFEDALYHASAAALLDRLRRVPDDVGSVLVVGHNPGLHDLVGLLAPPGPDAFPTGAIAGLRLEVEAWQEAAPGCAVLAELVVPRSLPR